LKTLVIPVTQSPFEAYEVQRRPVMSSPLEFAIVPTPEPESDPPRAAEAPRESQLILLLDDDQMLTDAVSRGLERPGRTIITCNDKESAELIVERLHPSHIVADIQLTGPVAFEGLDFIHHARRHAPDARIIVISDDSKDALQLEAAERGAVAFLHKPFDLEVLDATLDLMMCGPRSS
jgi:DNA-binding response OmpR family regulator